MTGHDQDWYAKGLKALEDRDSQNPLDSDPEDSTSEADVRETLIRPVLERVLGFKPWEIHAEKTRTNGHQRRPDYVCRRGGAGAKATCIFEVKKLKTKLLKRTGDDFKSSPVGQLWDYLNNFRDADDGTWGILSNGSEWFVVRREGDKVPYTVFGSPREARTLAEVKKS